MADAWAAQAALLRLTQAQPRSQGAPRGARFHGSVSAALSSSRLGQARRRARFLKVASAGAAVAGFGIDWTVSSDTVTGTIATGDVGAATSAAASAA
jgi:hypothetical protein